jgi:putative spermidine/putrescine transport system substrate-binding protein
MRRLSFLFALVLTFPAAAQEGDLLTVVSWGGAYEAAQRAALFEPFEEATGIEVEVARYDGGLDDLREQAEGGDPDWDIVDMTEEDARAACAEGLIQPLDGRALAGAGPEGQPPGEDFLPGAFSACGVVHLVFSTVIAYDDRAFPGEKPQDIADFFDLEKFPGKRALRRAPSSLLEWALMAEGVPIAQIYDLLSTERGLRLAFAKLDEIREEIVWWRGGEEPVDLLKSGEVAMASGYNGRFFHAGTVEGAPITVIWDGQILDTDAWTIVAGSGHREEAERFIRFALGAERLAGLAERIPYGPSRRSALDRIGLNAETGAPMRDHLPTAERRLDRALHRDAQWYASTRALRERRFEEWLQQGGDGEESAAGR